MKFVLACGLLLLSGSLLAAEPAVPAITVTTGAGGAQTWSVSIQVLMFMTALTLLPAALMMMTSFTRIIIVMSILRQALGTAQTPSNQILVGLSLFLTLFIMAPVLDKANAEGLQPYLKNEIKAEDALSRAAEPFRGFMLRQTREADLAMFTRLSGRAALNENEPVPFTLLVPAFITSELNTAFQIGFLLFVNLLVFVLAFFLDFFELAFILVPLLAPVASKLGIDLVWFGIILSVNMQTSFLHPPFGFALFFLRSVAAKETYIDRVTGKPMQPVTTEQIYWGAVPFVVIQIVMVALLIAFPGLAMRGDLARKPVEQTPAAQSPRSGIALPPLGLPDPTPGTPAAGGVPFGTPSLGGAPTLGGPPAISPSPRRGDGGPVLPRTSPFAGTDGGPTLPGTAPRI